jgi:hypothetical protein
VRDLVLALLDATSLALQRGGRHFPQKRRVEGGGRVVEIGLRVFVVLGELLVDRQRRPEESGRGRRRRRCRRQGPGKARHGGFLRKRRSASPSPEPSGGGLQHDALLVVLGIPRL